MESFVGACSNKSKHGEYGVRRCLYWFSFVFYCQVIVWTTDELEKYVGKQKAFLFEVLDSFSKLWYDTYIFERKRWKDD